MDYKGHREVLQHKRFVQEKYYFAIKKERRSEHAHVFQEAGTLRAQKRCLILNC